MGKSEKNAIESLLFVLLEHLLKLAYWESERARNINHWLREIRSFRRQIARLLKNNPSFKPYLHTIFAESYEMALLRVARSMEVTIKSLPSIPSFPLEQTLDDNWFPVPPHSDE